MIRAMVTAEFVDRVGLFVGVMTVGLILGGLGWLRHRHAELARLSEELKRKRSDGDHQ